MACIPPIRPLFLLVLGKVSSSIRTISGGRTGQDSKIELRSFPEPHYVGEATAERQGPSFSIENALSSSWCSARCQVLSAQYQEEGLVRTRRTKDLSRSPTMLVRLQRTTGTLLLHRRRCAWGKERPLYDRETFGVHSVQSLLKPHQRHTATAFLILTLIRYPDCLGMIYPSLD